MPRSDKEAGGAWRGQCKLGFAGRQHGSLELTSQRDRVFEQIENFYRRKINLHSHEVKTGVPEGKRTKGEAKIRYVEIMI